MKDIAVALITAVAAGIFFSWLVALQCPDLREPMLSWGVSAFAGSLVVSVSTILRNRNRNS